MHYWLTTILISLAILLPQAAKANVFCFCYDDPAKIDINNYKTAETDFLSTGLKYCEEAAKVAACNPDKIPRGGGKKYDSCDSSPLGQNLPAILPNTQTCKDAFAVWQGKKSAKLGAGKESESVTTAGLGALMPSCVNDERGCRDVGVFVEMGINLASYLFGIIGALALLMMVYGGITLIFSHANPEDIKKGGGIIMAAIMGLIIVFGAYILVQFLGDALVVSNFSLKG